MQGHLQHCNSRTLLSLHVSGSQGCNSNMTPVTHSKNTNILFTVILPVRAEVIISKINIPLVFEIPSARAAIEQRQVICIGGYMYVVVVTLASMLRLGPHRFFSGGKNLGRLWLAYTELQGDFFMLQFISVDSRHLTMSELSQGWSDLHEIKSVSFCIFSLE